MLYSYYVNILNVHGLTNMFIYIYIYEVVHILLLKKKEIKAIGRKESDSFD